MDVIDDRLIKNEKELVDYSLSLNVEVHKQMKNDYNELMRLFSVLDTQFTEKIQNIINQKELLKTQITDLGKQAKLVDDTINETSKKVIDLREEHRKILQAVFDEETMNSEAWIDERRDFYIRLSTQTKENRNMLTSHKQQKVMLKRLFNERQSEFEELKEKQNSMTMEHNVIKGYPDGLKQRYFYLFKIPLEVVRHLRGTPTKTIVANQKASALLRNYNPATMTPIKDPLRCAYRIEAKDDTTRRYMLEIIVSGDGVVSVYEQVNKLASDKFLRLVQYFRLDCFPDTMFSMPSYLKDPNRPVFVYVTSTYTTGIEEIRNENDRRVALLDLLYALRLAKRTCGFQHRALGPETLKFNKTRGPVNRSYISTHEDDTTTQKELSSSFNLVIINYNKSTTYEKIDQRSKSLLSGPDFNAFKSLISNELFIKNISDTINVLMAREDEDEYEDEEEYGEIPFQSLINVLLQ